MAKIYLSSTYRDLAAHREAVYDALRKMRHDVVSMEDYTAASRPPLDKCLEDVRNCDVYVGIFAWRSGYRPPEESRSITELEFREAVKSGKECLLFLLDDNAPWSPGLIDSDRSEITRLREELKRDYVVGFFRSAEDLATEVAVAVAKLTADDVALAEGGVPDEASQRFYLQCLERMTGELASQIRLYRVSSTALMVAGVVILGVGFVLKLTFFGMGGILVGTATLFPISTMLTTRRKKVLLDGYEHGLRQRPPAREVLLAVRTFLRTQLKGEVFA